MGTRDKVQQVIEESGAETTRMFMDAFRNQTIGRILDTLVFLYGEDDEEKELYQSAVEIKKAVEWIELHGDPYE